VRRRGRRAARTELEAGGRPPAVGRPSLAVLTRQGFQGALKISERPHQP
jgi:hypothetical protein